MRPQASDWHQRDAAERITRLSRGEISCPRGDLNTETGEISPDRGNHAISITGAGHTHPVIPRRVRYMLFYLACMPLGGTAGPLHPYADYTARVLRRPPDAMPIAAHGSVPLLPRTSVPGARAQRRGPPVKVARFK